MPLNDSSCIVPHIEKRLAWIYTFYLFPLQALCDLLESSQRCLHDPTAISQLSPKRIPQVEKKRPMNLDLGTIRLPITSYVSILHRVSGVAMFFAVAIFLWMLDTSLASEQGFAMVNSLFDNLLAQIIVWGCLSALAYHMVMGTRHLVMDAGYGETFESGRLTAKIAAVVAASLIGLIGGWIFIW